jgi:hypothetical protein
MSEESNVVHVVYSIDDTVVTIVGVFSTHERAFACCEKVNKGGNSNVWMVARTVDS